MAALTIRSNEGEVLDILGMPLRYLCDVQETGGAWSLMEEEIPHGAGPAAHRHDWDEAYYVLDGTIDFEVDGEAASLSRGDFTYLPRGTIHGFKGGSTQPARVLIFACPAHASDFFKEVDREVKTFPDDLDRLPEIGARHGIEFVAGS